MNTFDVNDVKKRFYLQSAKPFLDFIAAFILLTLLSPLLLLVALLIKLTSKGPVFFRQDRIGLGGEPIKIFKFRSMSVMENGDYILQAQKNDWRITIIGGFLRKSSIDELPQLINVLLGDMSLVGPRPHAISHDRKFAAQIPDYKLRYNVLPGMTGYAQVKGFRGETDTIGKLLGRVKFDLKYIQNASFFLDINILFKTISVVLFSKNAY